MANYNSHVYLGTDAIFAYRIFRKSQSTNQTFEGVDK